MRWKPQSVGKRWVCEAVTKAQFAQPYKRWLTPLTLFMSWKLGVVLYYLFDCISELLACCVFTDLS